jgi:hypothetical protein
MKSLVLGLLGLFVFCPVVHANSEPSSAKVVFEKIQEIHKLNLESLTETLLLQLRYRSRLSPPSLPIDDEILIKNDKMLHDIYSAVSTEGLLEYLITPNNEEPSNVLSWLGKSIQSLADSFKVTIEGTEFNITLFRNVDYPPIPLLSIILLNPFEKALDDIENKFNYEDEYGEPFIGNWGPDAQGLSGTLESLVIQDITESFRNTSLTSIVVPSLHEKIEKYRDQFLILNQYINILNLRGSEDIQRLKDDLLEQKKNNISISEEPISTDLIILTASIDKYKSYIYLYLGALEKALQKSILVPISSITLLEQDFLNSIKQDVELLINDIKAVCKGKDIETDEMSHTENDFHNYNNQNSGVSEQTNLENFLRTYPKTEIQGQS